MLTIIPRQMESRKFPSPRPEARNGEPDQSMSWGRWDELVKTATEPDADNRMSSVWNRPESQPPPEPAPFLNSAFLQTGQRAYAMNQDRRTDPCINQVKSSGSAHNAENQDQTEPSHSTTEGGMVPNTDEEARRNLSAENTSARDLDVRSRPSSPSTHRGYIFQSAKSVLQHSNVPCARNISFTQITFAVICRRIQTSALPFVL
jgi:hypothetical protein